MGFFAALFRKPTRKNKRRQNPKTFLDEPARRLTTPSSERSDSRAKPQSSGSSTADVGLGHVDVVQLRCQDRVRRIELIGADVNSVETSHATGLLIIYLPEARALSRNEGATTCALERQEICLDTLSSETHMQLDYRDDYRCWLSEPISVSGPNGSSYQRVLVYQAPTADLMDADRVVSNVLQCLVTVIGDDIQITSILLRLSGVLVRTHLRTRLLRSAAVGLYTGMKLGLPLEVAKILVPTADFSGDVQIFHEATGQLERAYLSGRDGGGCDVFISHAAEDHERAAQLASCLKNVLGSARIFRQDQRFALHTEDQPEHFRLADTIGSARVFLALVSEPYMRSTECANTLTMSCCRGVSVAENFVVPVLLDGCDLTPLVGRIAAVSAVDCRGVPFSELCDTVCDAVASKLSAAEALDGSLSGVSETRDRNDRAGEFLEQSVAGPLPAAKELVLEEQSCPSNRLEKLRDELLDEAWQHCWAVGPDKLEFGPRIDAGGFGEVCKAKYKGETVAVKTIRSSRYEEHSEVHSEFLLEMKLMSRLEHPHIVAFLGALTTPRQLAIVLEYMPRGSLHTNLQTRRRHGMGPFPLYEILGIAHCIARGVAYLHSQYPVVVHRDLKSANVLLGSDCHGAKLTDFGLSRLRVSTLVDTGPGGTPEWMAPELLRQERFDEAADVFSFGVILWELITCEKPWKDDSPMQVVAKVGSKRERLRLGPSVQTLPELRDMVAACFREKPEQRPQSLELVRSLRYLCERASGGKSFARAGSGSAYRTSPR